MLTSFVVVWTYLRAVVNRWSRDDAGYTTETVLVTALLVACALVVIGLVVAAVTHKAASIQF